MGDHFDDVVRRLARLDRLDPSDLETSRRSLITRVVVAAAALGGVALPITDNRSVLGAPRERCSPSKVEYEVAEKERVVSDALGTRRVKPGDFIVVAGGVDDRCLADAARREAGVFADPAACGVTFSNNVPNKTRLGRDWSSVNCRSCPTIPRQNPSQNVVATLRKGNDIFLRMKTYQGLDICRGRSYGYGSSIWFRTSGTQGCWFWSGSTRDADWNTDC